MLGPDVYVEPHFAAMLAGEVEYLLMRRERLDGRRTTEVIGVLDRLVVGEIANDQNDRRVLGPDSLRQRLEAPPVVLIDGFLVAQLDILEAVRRRMPIRGATAAPVALCRAVGIFHEVRHIRRTLVHIDRGDAEEASGLAEVQEVRNAPAIRGMRIPGPLIRRSVVGRPDHLLPAIFSMVDHRTAVAQHRQALGNQCLTHILAHRQTLEPPPLPGLEKSIAEADRAGLLQCNRKAPGLVVRIGRELELDSLPLGPFDFDVGLRIQLGAISAFQRQEQAHGMLCAQPQVTLVALALDEVHPPPVEALVFYADFAVALLERHSLALPASERVLRFQRPSALCRSAAEPAPHPAHLALVQRRRRRRFLKALAKDYLAIQLAIDFVVYILDTGPGQVAADPMGNLVGMNDNLRFLSRRQTAPKQCARD